MHAQARDLGRHESGTADRVPDLGSGEEKARKNDNFFAGMQKITTFACLFGEKP